MFVLVAALCISAPQAMAATIPIPDQNVFEVVFSIDGVKYSAIVEKSTGLENRNTISSTQKNRDLYFNLAFQAGTFKCLPAKGKIVFECINTDLSKLTIPQSMPYISENDLMYIQSYPVVILEINCYPEK